MHHLTMLAMQVGGAGGSQGHQQGAVGGPNSLQVGLYALLSSRSSM